MCIQCQPGEALDKECGGGKNGDARCLPCEEGTFSSGGTHYSCTPCRICVNSEVLKECDSASDRVCGSCLPGFFQDADNPSAFFDSSACPNRCADNPRSTPQCQEWWKAQEADRAPPTEDVIQENNAADHQLNVIDMESGDSNVVKSSQENNPSNTGTYVIVVIILASILVIVAVVGIMTFLRYLRNSSAGPSSGSAESAMLQESLQSTPQSSPNQSPDMHFSRTGVYNPTVYSTRSQFTEDSVLRDIIRRYMPDIITDYMQGSRPSSTVSSHGAPTTQNSSAISTPVPRLRSECHQALLQPKTKIGATEMKSHADDRPDCSDSNLPLERQTTIPQPNTVVTENSSGDAIALLLQSSSDAPVDPSNETVMRRRSVTTIDRSKILSSSNEVRPEKNGNGHHGNGRRDSIHNLPQDNTVEREAALNPDSDSSESVKKLDFPRIAAKLAKQPGVAGKDATFPIPEEATITPNGKTLAVDLGRPEESSRIHRSASGNVNINITVSTGTVEKVQVGDEHNHFHEEEETAPFITSSPELDDYDCTEKSSFVDHSTF